MVDIIIDKFDQKEEDSWDDFVNSCIEENHIVTFAHNTRIGLALEKTFNYKYSLLLFKKNEKSNNIIGGFPYCKVGKNYVSMPHLSYGGLLGRNDLLENLNSLLEKDFKHYEIRDFLNYTKYYNSNKIATFLNIKRQNTEDIFGCFSSNHRRKIRKSYKNGLKTLSGSSDLLDQFYYIYTKNMHRLGSPPLPKLFFSNLLLYTKEGESQIFITYYKNRPIGGGFVLSYGKFTEDCWLSSLSAYNNLYVTYQLYWEMIKWAIEKDDHYFSFGRSTVNSSLHKFKKQWKPEERNLYFSYNHRVNLDIKNMTFLNSIWKKLPYKLTTLFSKEISKRIY